MTSPSANQASTAAEEPTASAAAPKRIILDCDPGHDDAIAIMLAAGDPALELAAITTVAGNQTIDKVTRNARIVATLCGLTDVPIAAGASLPLVRAQRIAPDIHGETGLDGPDMPEPAIDLDPRHAVDVIIDTIRSSPPHTITLVPTGPLTNIALAIRHAPDIVDRVAEVVLMGGAYQRGNVTPAAEFNILVDPEAAAAVFAADWTVTMVGLDLTHQALATPAIQQRIADLGTPISRFSDDLLDFFRARYVEAQGFDNPAVHDPCAVALVADPTLITTVPAHVDVELAGTFTAGMTVVDFRIPDPANARHHIATVLDQERFWDRVITAIAALPRA